MEEIPPVKLMVVPGDADPVCCIVPPVWLRFPPILITIVAVPLEKVKIPPEIFKSPPIVRVDEEGEFAINLKSWVVDPVDNIDKFPFTVVRLLDWFKLIPV